MIQFHQVTKQYPGNDFALGEIDFNIDEGEFVFLIGPSGSGKTTLIRMLIREERPSEGKIFFDDRDITNLSRNNVYKLRRQIGVIFQDYKLIPDKNAYENVAFAMEAAGRSNREIKETVPYVLDIVGLAHRANAFPEQLSGGEKQRIAIARAVSNNPRLLIADEPTGNLDPASAWDIVQILSKINNWGTTVIMSTHGTDIVNTLNKRVIQMESGRVVRDDNKGMYEITAKFEDRVLSEGDGKPAEQSESIDATRKGPIKVNIAKDEEVVKSKKGFNLDWLKIWKHEEAMPVSNMPSLVEDNAEMEEVIEEANAALDESTEVDIDTNDEAEMDQILDDADHTPVTELDIRPQIIADLQTAGYHDIEDIISAGPEQLANELIIDPEEVVLISEAISKFVKEEDTEIKSGNKPKRNKKEKKQEEEPVLVEPEKLMDEDPPKAQIEEQNKAKSKRVKLDLAGKK